ncbi:MAG: glycosyltransferase, partial [Elusimicrobia bacterium]|nr:glycosyltransferase [Elusimicrobiota bacterium]
KEGIWAGAKYLSESMASKNLPGRVKRFLRGAGRDFKGGYESWISYFSGEEKAGLYGAGLMPVLSRSPHSLQGKLDGPDDIFAFEIRNYLPDDLLCLADRTSMANSLELRVPFLDIRLVEFMAGAPLALKTRGFNLKYLLKKAMAGKLPAGTISAGKMGFQVPLARWYNEEIKDFAHEVLSPSALRKSGYLNPAYIALLLKRHESGRRNLSDQIYAAMMFELWLMNAAKPVTSNQSPVTSEREAVPEVSVPPGLGGRPLTVLVCSDIIPCDEAGGSGRVAWETALRILKRGHKVLVLTKGSAGKKDFEVIKGVEIYRYRANPLRARAMVRRILETHKRIDVLELHHPYTAFWALRLLKGVPAVYNFHSPWAEEFLIRSGDLKLNAVGKALGAAVRKLMERGVLKSSKAILNASAFMADKLRSAHGLESRIIPLGVDTRKFMPAPDTAAVREKLCIPRDRFVIFTVRDLVSRMGLENLVEAAASVAKKEPGALFIIGGRGYLREKLERMIARRGLSGQVRLEGYIPEEKLPLYYQCTDLFVLPTRLLEGFGLVTLEALACGTPVLATPVAANVEVLGGFDKSLLLKSEAPADIAGGILAFMSGYPARRAQLRAACRQFVERNYSWEKYADEVEKILYEIGGTDHA